MAKYWRLRQLLERQRADEIVLSFEELESILGHPLPPSARKYRAWWSNSPHGHSHARAWLEAGWKVEQVDVAGGEVVFVRSTSEQGGRIVGDRVEGTRLSTPGGREADSPWQAAGGMGRAQELSKPPASTAVRAALRAASGFGYSAPASARTGILVTDKDRLLKVFRLFAALDAIRWQSAENYNLINYSTGDLSAEGKLLCHWICYITDRQMPFRFAWEVGGYVLSHAVRVFAEGGTEAVLAECLQRRETRDGPKWRWLAPLKGPNEILKQRGIYHGPVEFASRFMPADTVSIIRTLRFLEACCEKKALRGSWHGCLPCRATAQKRQIGLQQRFT